MSLNWQLVSDAPLWLRLLQKQGNYYRRYMLCHKKRWLISLWLPAIRCDCRCFVKESNRFVFSWWYQCIWWEARTLSFKVYGLSRKYITTSYTNQGLSREKDLYLSQTYFVAHSKCDLLDLDFIDSDDISFDYSPNFANNLQPTIYADMASSTPQVISTNLTSTSHSFSPLSQLEFMSYIKLRLHWNLSYINSDL